MSLLFVRLLRSYCLQLFVSNRIWVFLAHQSVWTTFPTDSQFHVQFRNLLSKVQKFYKLENFIFKLNWRLGQFMYPLLDQDKGFLTPLNSHNSTLIGFIDSKNIVRVKCICFNSHFIRFDSVNSEHVCSEVFAWAFSLSYPIAFKRIVVSSKWTGVDLSVERNISFIFVIKIKPIRVLA